MHARIVACSATGTLKSTYYAFDGFIDLSDRYSRWIWQNYAPQFFVSTVNTAWMLYAKYQALIAHIMRYEHGKMTTVEFLDALHNELGFPKAASLEEEDLERIKNNTNQLYLSQHVESQGEAGPFRMLLEMAWNAVVQIQESDLAKWVYFLTECSAEKPLYIAAQSNELNIFMLLSQLRECFPEIQWSELSEAVQSTDENGVIRLAPNVYLCASYLVPEIKTADEEQALKLSREEALVERLITKRLAGTHPSNIEVVSDNDKHFKLAKTLGVAETHLKKSNSFLQRYEESKQMQLKS